jgi:hypothetical protein
MQQGGVRRCGHCIAAVFAYTPPDHPHRDQRPAQRLNERRERPHVIGQFLAPVPEGLELGLRGWVRDHQPPDLSVHVPERHGRLIGPDRRRQGLPRGHEKPRTAARR